MIFLSLFCPFSVFGWCVVTPSQNGTALSFLRGVAGLYNLAALGWHNIIVKITQRGTEWGCDAMKWLCKGATLQNCITIKPNGVLMSKQALSLLIARSKLRKWQLYHWLIFTISNSLFLILSITATCRSLVICKWLLHWAGEGGRETIKKMQSRSEKKQIHLLNKTSTIQRRGEAD